MLVLDKALHDGPAPAARNARITPADIEAVICSGAYYVWMLEGYPVKEWLYQLQQAPEAAPKIDGLAAGIK